MWFVSGYYTDSVWLIDLYEVISAVSGGAKTIYCPCLVKIKTLYGTDHKGLKCGHYTVSIWIVYGRSFLSGSFFRSFSFNTCSLK